MNEESKKRGHTFWEPAWYGGLVGILGGGCGAVLLFLPIYVIWEAVTDDHTSSSESTLNLCAVVAVSCLWGSGWATYWHAHKEGREFGVKQEAQRTEEVLQQADDSHNARKAELYDQISRLEKKLATYNR